VDRETVPEAGKLGAETFVEEEAGIVSVPDVCVVVGCGLLEWEGSRKENIDQYLICMISWGNKHSLQR
jgi:hypothetical protein